jgi:hypothetical protein
MPVQCLWQTSILMASHALQVASIFSITLNLPTKINMDPFSCTSEERSLFNLSSFIGSANRDVWPRYSKRLFFGGRGMQ